MLKRQAAVKAVGRFFKGLVWWGFGLWAALAALYQFPGPSALRVSAALVIAALFFLGRKDSRLRRAALAAAAMVAIYYFGFVNPDPNLNWAKEHSQMPIVEIEGSKVRVGNVRNFTWKTGTESIPAFYERVYDADKIETMYYILAPLPSLQGVAHVWVSFSFSDGQHVTISVEGRREVGQTYQIIPSMFRKYQLIYVVADERDVVGLRGIWGKIVRFYPARAAQERKKAIFLDMMKRADSLEHHPEFYNLIFNNCLNNITYHLRRLGGHSLPHDLTLLLTGLSDRVAYNLGYIDTDLPFEKAREAFRIDGWMQTAPRDADFSVRLRQHLRQQVAEKAKTLP